MSSKSYARKAEKFSISNPDASATDGQRNQIGRLLRFKDHNVEFGNLMVEVLDAPGFTRGEARKKARQVPVIGSPVRTSRAYFPLAARPFACLHCGR